MLMRRASGRVEAPVPAQAEMRESRVGTVVRPESMCCEIVPYGLRRGRRDGGVGAAWTAEAAPECPVQRSGVTWNPGPPERTRTPAPTVRR